MEKIFLLKASRKRKKKTRKKKEWESAGRQAAESQGRVSCKAEPGHGVGGQEVTWRSDWAERKETRP